ncbi:MAG: FGGY family carbohydrate kinase [Marinilabiliales bacterium]|nr:FGGY family carbohydrate kinase [Marinilabiliales bacterium]
MRQNTAKTRIKAVTITTQRSTLINLDSEGKSLRPAITWLDQRQCAVGKYPDKLTQMALQGCWHAGSGDTTPSSSGECNWLMQNTPEISGRKPTNSCSSPDT